MHALDELYVSRRSWLHAADPRAKLLLVASALVVLLAYKNLYCMLAALVLLHALHASARIPPRKIALAWQSLLPVSLLMAALWTLFYPSGPSLAQVGPIRVTAIALAQGAALGLRIITMGLAVLLWLYTTDHPAIVRSLVKLGLPFEWGLALALALRYIPVFLDSYRMIAEAQQARGLNLAAAGIRRKVQALMPVFVALVISSLRASEQLALALEARAVGARGVRRTYLRDIHFRPGDYAMAVVVAGLTALLLYLRVHYGFGSLPLRLV
jgi:energy-coupling factor transport system permease protein